MVLAPYISQLRTAALLLCLGMPLAAHALDLPSTATQTGERDEGYATQAFPRDAYTMDGTAMLEVEGDVDHSAYRITGTNLTSAQIMAPLREQLQNDGFAILFACPDRACGGFDFRYLLDLLPDPQMHVDLGHFDYLLAQHPDGRTLAIVTSHAATSGFIQISRVTPAEAPDITLSDTPPNRVDDLTLPDQDSPLISILLRRGHVALDDLSFDTGATALGEGPFASLTALATYLESHTGSHVALVGHTDNVGGLDTNTKLSRARAQAVRQRLIDAHAVNPAQLSAEGIGYLAPRSTNATAEGRERNRRVEAVLAPTP